MNQYTIRHAVDSDKERIYDIYAFARKFMAENGNPNQWKNNNPSREIIDNDIAAGNLYVIEEADKEQQTEGTNNKNSRVHGVFFFKMGEDALLLFVPILG